jgi:hypothetical protein
VSCNNNNVCFVIVDTRSAAGEYARMQDGYVENGDSKQSRTATTYDIDKSEENRG